MAIPASHIVEVIPRVIDGGSADLELNGLLLSDNALISASTMVLSFPSARAVGDYFGLDSVEHIAADVYFTSYNNKFSTPKAFLVARRVAEAAPAWLRGGPVEASVEELRKISDGAFDISVGGQSKQVSGLSFASANSYSDAAQVIEGKISSTLAKVEYSSLKKAFIITSVSTGAASSISFASTPASGTDISALLKLREEDGAIVSEGMDALSVNEQMAKIRAKTENWVSFTTAFEHTIDSMLEYAAWASRNYGWLYVAYTTSPMVPSPDFEADPASVLKESGYDHTAIVYGSLEYAAFIMGTVASIAWQRANGAITAAFKKQSGLAPWVVDESTAAILEKKKCNYFGNFATRNAEFVFLYPGCLCASDYGFIDPYVNSVWLNNRLQVSLLDGISSVGRVPYNTRGYTMIKAWMMDPVNDARNNAVIEPGINLSEKQKSEIMNEAGLDISGELLTQGYYIQVLDPGASVRSQRGTPVISLWYTYGGAVQKIEVASTAIL